MGFFIPSHTASHLILCSSALTSGMTYSLKLKMEKRLQRLSANYSLAQKHISFTQKIYLCLATCPAPACQTWTDMSLSSDPPFRGCRWKPSGPLVSLLGWFGFWSTPFEKQLLFHVSFALCLSLWDSKIFLCESPIASLVIFTSWNKLNSQYLIIMTSESSNIWNFDL